MGSYGVDISEFQAGTPGGFGFYLIRTLNENGREDSRWRQHHDEAAGHPRGPYGIIQPWNIDPTVWAQRFAATLSAGWELTPTVDIELGDPNQNRIYASTVVDYLHGRGIPVVMGYYSAGSAYRQACSFLFQRQWLAAWGSPYPAGADVHQWQGSPLDLDYCPDLGRVGGGSAPAPPAPPPYPIAMVTEEEEH